MKLLTVTVPCYNSESYMEHCVSTLLAGGEDVEIIIVNDGSKDRTLEIANRLQSEHPTIVKVIDKENGGHGSGVNAGIQNATGKYFKVVDSDDWVDENVFVEILAKLREFEAAGESVDMFLNNFIYDKVGEKNKKVMEYTGILPVDTVFSWQEAGRFPQGKYILMHSVIYRTEVLRECGLKLPEHTFYVDDIFVFQPLPYIKRMYYMDKVFYHYFIGRDDQSVQMPNMIKRIDQQIRVNKIMVDIYTEVCKSITDKKNPCIRYMFKDLEIITAITSIVCYNSHSKELYAKKTAVWNYIKEVNPSVYKKLRWRYMGFGLHVKGWLGRHLCRNIYKICQKHFGFN